MSEVFHCVRCGKQTPNYDILLCDDCAKICIPTNKIMKANPQPVKAPPICLNCALCIVPPGWTPEAAQIPNNTLDTPRCRISHMMDVVSGSLFYPPCVDMRNPGGPCKFEGVLFVKKDEAPKPQEGTAPNTVAPEAAGLDAAHPGAERSVEPDKTGLN